MSGWRPNPGRCPADAKGKRVNVRLRNGSIGRCDDNPMSPAGWAADTCSWVLDEHPFAIVEYEVVA